MKLCPSCADDNGKSIRLVDLTTDPRLSLHCDNCHYEWPFPASPRDRARTGRVSERTSPSR